MGVAHQQNVELCLFSKVVREASFWYYFFLVKKRIISRQETERERGKEREGGREREGENEKVERSIEHA